MHDEDDIRRFIEDLNDAQGFEVETTAVDGWPVDDDDSDDPMSWLDRVALQALRRVTRFPADPPFGVAVVEGPERGRLYEQGPCETGTWFAERVGREARAVDTPWLFALAPDVRGFANRLWQEWAAFSPLGVLDVRWYAELRGRGRADRVWGTIEPEAGGLSLLAWDTTGAPTHLERVLRGHPARRKHRIKRATLDEMALRWHGVPDRW